MKKAFSFVLCAFLIVSILVGPVAALDDGLLLPSESYIGHVDAEDYICINKINHASPGAGDTIFYFNPDGDEITLAELVPSLGGNFAWWYMFVVVLEDGQYRISEILGADGTAKEQTVIPEGGFVVALHSLAGGTTAVPADDREEADIVNVNAENMVNRQNYAVNDIVEVTGIPAFSGEDTPIESAPSESTGDESEVPPAQTGDAVWLFVSLTVCASAGLLIALRRRSA